MLMERLPKFLKNFFQFGRWRSDDGLLAKLLNLVIQSLGHCAEGRDKTSKSLTEGAECSIQDMLYFLGYRQRPHSKNATAQQSTVFDIMHCSAKPVDKVCGGVHIRVPQKRGSPLAGNRTRGITRTPTEPNYLESLRQALNRIAKENESSHTALVCSVPQGNPRRDDRHVSLAG